MLQSPLGTIIPENFVWIKFVPYRINAQSVGGQRGTSMQDTRIPDQEIKLLCPENFAWNYNHEWDTYESMSSRLLGKLGEFAKIKSEADALGGSLPNISKQIGKGVTDAISGNWSETASSVFRSGTQLYTGLTGAKVENVKVDLPLVFQGSGRREIVLEFKLLAIQNVKKEVYDIVRQFELFSAAESVGDLHLNPPYVFSILSEPGSLINIYRAAITSCQPSYKAPYDKNGYPFSCDLTLTLKDMSPLYRRTIETGGYPVTTSTEGELPAGLQ